MSDHPTKQTTAAAVLEDEYAGDWVECWNCCGEGEIEDEDWQFAGAFYQCDICDGKGGWPRSSDPFHDDEASI